MMINDIEARLKEFRAARQAANESNTMNNVRRVMAAEHDVKLHAVNDIEALLGIVKTLNLACDEAHVTLCHYDLVRRPNGVDWKPVNELQTDLIEQLWQAILLLFPELRQSRP